MKKAILATKVGMTQIFNEDGILTPVTVLQAGPCVVTQVKTVENDGYSAVQIGFVDKNSKIVNSSGYGRNTASGRVFAPAGSCVFIGAYVLPFVFHGKHFILWAGDPG